MSGLFFFILIGPAGAIEMPPPIRPCPDSPLLRALLRRTIGNFRPARVFREGAENGARGGRAPHNALETAPQTSGAGGKPANQWRRLSQGCSQSMRGPALRMMMRACSRRSRW